MKIAKLSSKIQVGTKFLIINTDGDDSIIDKIYLYIKDSNEGKYQCLIKNANILVLNNVKI